MGMYFCKNCGTSEHIGFAVEVTESENGCEFWINAVCDGCKDWIAVDVTSAMDDFFDYFGENRDVDTLMLD